MKASFFSLSHTAPGPQGLALKAIQAEVSRCERGLSG